MQKQIDIDNKRVDYTLKMSGRARRLRLAIYGDGSFVVTAPHGLSESAVEKFIFQKARWILKNLERIKNFSPKIFTKKTNRDYLLYKSQAFRLANERIEYFNQTYGYKVNRISIRNQKTRWGSCSQKGNLNFNYKIALLPEKLADYIIVHELCHLKEMNHSHKFWNLVARHFPDYLLIRKELKKIII